MNSNKDNIISFMVSLAIHIIIFLILGIMTLKSVIPDEDGGVLVNFGNINSAAGTFEPKYTGETTAPKTTVPPPPPVEKPAEPSSKEELVTQNIEESIAIKEAKKKKKQQEEKARQAEKEKRRLAQLEKDRLAKEKAEKERLEKIRAEKARIAEEKRKKEEAIKNKLAGAFGMGSGKNTSQGDGETGSGNQGSPFGNSDHGANSGVGGYGSFNLNGRSIGTNGLPKPTYTVQEEGKIVINITVDSKGNVIFAEIGRGTNIDNASMRRSAIEAAKRAKFNAIKSTNNQNGTITYVYKLL